MKRAMQPKMDISLLVQKFAELQAAIAAVHQESLRLTKKHGGTGIPYSPEREAVEAMEIAIVETVWFTAAAIREASPQARHSFTVADQVRQTRRRK